MGMYDVVSDSLAKRIITKCPACSGNLLKDDVEWDSDRWQTKDFECILETLVLDDIIKYDDGECIPHEMHTICSNCGTYVSVMFDIYNGSYNAHTHNLSTAGHIEDISLRKDFICCKDMYWDSRIDDAFKQYDKGYLNKHSITVDTIMKMYNIDESMRCYLEKLSSAVYFIPKDDE